MPELPEVEMVRRGLDAHILDRTIEQVRIFDERALKRHPYGPRDLEARLQGLKVVAVDRRGKFLWISAGSPSSGESVVEEQLMVHLGMSGQMLIAADGRDDRSQQQPGAALHRHTRISAYLDDGLRLDFVDQRLFGGWSLSEGEVEAHGRRVPREMAHIAADPFEAVFDAGAVARRMKRSRAAVKSLLLQQGLVSGIGNIYADEALWRMKINGAREGASVPVTKLTGLLNASREVMTDALAEGGTSFDSLYRHVNGESGYFARSLQAYGRTGEPCSRCGTLLVKEQFMNRSSHFCPRCQRRR
ncbi:bifunctional DNA-formamidopyrimidine glycosylase/DNA-(apurinic or apyrimidinic site) lyase [Gordonia sp. VNK21]|uniref:bifunctional DNA-formamidopyrimidine glycosylase/DNA-(apurinic or apyrimidinic site) lyase n=1 Tax=Gordonia sp. VNK21 TaxID=3382483 RepID=UPI0038D36A06